MCLFLAHRIETEFFMMLLRRHWTSVEVPSPSGLAVTMCHRWLCPCMATMCFNGLLRRFFPGPGRPFLAAQVLQKSTVEKWIKMIHDQCSNQKIEKNICLLKEAFDMTI